AEEGTAAPLLRRGARGELSRATRVDLVPRVREREARGHPSQGRPLPHPHRPRAPCEGRRPAARLALVEPPVDGLLDERLVDDLARVEALYLVVPRGQRGDRVTEELRPRERLRRDDLVRVEVVGRAHRGVVGRLEVLIQYVHHGRLVLLSLRVGLLEGVAVPCPNARHVPYH